MRFFGYEVSVQRAAPPMRRAQGTLAPVSSDRRGWFPIIREPFAGAWQRNQELTADTVLAFHAVYSCVTLIAADIGKLRLKLVEHLDSDVWRETTSAAFTPVLRKPNRYQNHIQFKEWWMSSKLITGNTYALKERDARGVTSALYLLDPTRVTPLVAPDGSVFYQLRADNLSGLTDDVTIVPASEILHDRMNCLFHPLVGLSPLFAAGLGAAHGLKIQENSAAFFESGSVPAGVLTAPGEIDDETARTLKERWDEYREGRGVAVLGDGLKYEPLRMTAVDAQLIEQLKYTAEVVCSVFHVPPYMVGVGPMPTYNNIEALNQQYYSQCLQSLIESFELVLDEGLGLDSTKDGKTLGTELDLEGLLRMDTTARFKAHTEAIGGGWLAPNEARRKEDLPPVKGGDTPYMQQQNYALAALAERDANDPFAKPTPAPAPQPTPPANTPPPDDEGDEDNADEVRAMADFIVRELEAA